MSTTDRTSSATTVSLPAAPPPNGKPRSANEIEAEIAQARDDLARTLDQIADRTNPKNIAKRGAAKARGFVQTPEGSLRPKQVAIVAAVVVVLVVYQVRKARLR